MRFSIVFKSIDKKELLRNVLIFIVTFIGFLIFLHFIRFPDVNGDSMLPTYQHEDVVVTFYTKSNSNKTTPKISFCFNVPNNLESALVFLLSPNTNTSPLGTIISTVSSDTNQSCSFI